MSEIKHTPGPWSVEDPLGADVGFWIVQDGLQAFEWSCIAMVTGDDEETRSDHSRYIGPEEQEANACLIAAAPQMLAALKGLTDYSRKPLQEDWRAADEAIAKAEGRP